MERMESSVVQAAPSYENDKIQEMQGFGWSLQGRQEIHEEGEAYGRPSYLSEFTGTYVVKTKVSQYVKLHFVRSVGMPNLDQIKRLEAEYFNLPFPQSASFTGPGCFTAFGAVGVLVGLLGLFAKEGPPAGLLVLYVPWVLLGVYWIKSRSAKRKAARETVQQSVKRMEEIRAQVASLL